MLEGRKLSLDMQRDSNGRFWSVIALALMSACLLLVASLWIGMAIPPPPPDKSQENMAQAHAKVLESLQQLKNNLSADQALTPELFSDMAKVVPLLTEFAQAAVKATPASANAQDPQMWPGRAHLISEDLNTLLLAKDAVLNMLRTRDSLSALYKPKGAISPQASVPLSAFREFSTAVADWGKLSAGNSTATKSQASSIPAPANWRLVLDAKAPWLQINSQLDALEGEAKQTDNAAQVKAAQTLLNALNQGNLSQQIRATDAQVAKVWTAHERLLTSLEQLPPVPQVILPPPPFSWSQLAFPGKAVEGLMGAMALLVISLAVLLALHISKQQHLKDMSQKWLALTLKLENTLRDVTQPIATSIHQQEELVAEFNSLLEQSRLLQLTLNTPVETPEKNLEDQAWSAAARIQADLESELSLLREKLLNIHLQFCSGATHENLVYDLAFTTEGIQTVLTTASDLGRSFAILKQHLHQNDVTGNDTELVAMMSQISNLKISVKRTHQQLRELSHKLQVAVEDVPDGKRFDAISAHPLPREPHGNPSV